MLQKLSTTQKKQHKMQQNKTSLVQSPFTTLGQEMRWAYSTTLLTEPTWGRMDGWFGFNSILTTQAAAISCLTESSLLISPMTW